MLVVVVLLWVLTAIIVPAITKNLQNTRNTARETQATAIKRWLETYYVNNSTLPEPDSYITITWANNTYIKQWVVWDTVAWVIWLDRVPTDPSNANTYYTYSISSDGTKYWIFILKEWTGFVYRWTNPVVLSGDMTRPTSDINDINDGNHNNYHIILPFTWDKTVSDLNPVEF